MDNYGYRGTQDPASSAGDFGAYSYLIYQILSRVNTATLVKITAVSNTGAIAPVGYVDVQPLVNQIDGSSNAVPHGVVHNLPYARLQGGTDAVIIDPKVGDIGIAVFVDHDISAVKSSKKQSNPGSLRRFDMADGVYIGGLLNGTPMQYVAFSDGGIDIVSPTKIRAVAPEIVFQAEQKVSISASEIVLQAETKISLAAPAIELDGPLTQGEGSFGGNATMGGSLAVAGDVTASGTSLHTHTHGGVETGGGNTGGPN